MKIDDIVYGEENVEESVLVDLINSNAVQRLKGINQFGMPDKYYYRKNYSRYEHSIGVFILLRRLKGNLMEQIAGLLHDISHTAFSHVIDRVLGDPTKEDYQDTIHKQIIESSNIPVILGRFNISPVQISNPENFSLLEREAPSLCADRVDYTLREISQTGDAHHFFLDLINKNGQICFKSREIGEEFANIYMNLQKGHWAGDEARIRYQILGGVLKSALEKQIISMEDLRETDQEVINLLIQSRDTEILDGLNLLERGFEIVPSEQGIEAKKKFRYIDPEILVNGSYQKLSELSSRYAYLLLQAKKDSKLIKKVKIIPN